MNIGDAVISTAGRDAGRIFLVTGVENGQYCYICDGKLRKTVRPKKKKVKHLKKIYGSDGEILSLLQSESVLSDKKIRRILAELKAKNGEE